MALEILASLAVSAIGSAASGGIAEGQRRARFREYLAQLEISKRKELYETVDLVGGQIRGMAQSAKASGARRAAAMGRTEDKESIIAPIEARAQTIGSKALRQAVTSVNSAYRSAKLQAEADFANRPLPPNVGDFLQTVGEGATEYFLNKDMLNTQKGNQPIIPPTPAGVIGTHGYARDKRYKGRSLFYQPNATTISE